MNPPRLEQVPLRKVVKAWARFLAEISLYVVVSFYLITFMTSTLTRFGQTYNQVFTEQRQHQTLWEDYCKNELERHTHPPCEVARKYLLVNPYGRIVNLVVQDMPILGMCGKHENCWMAAVAAIQFLVSWSMVVKTMLLAISFHVLWQTIMPHFLGAARLTKTYKTTQKSIVGIPIPLT